jgi:hypothetical protein
MLIGSQAGFRVFSLDTSFKRRLEMERAGYKLEEVKVGEYQPGENLRQFIPRGKFLKRS